MKYYFIIVVNSYTLSFASVAVVLGIPITLISGNACDNLQVGQCPVLSGNTFTFSIEYTMLVTIPAVCHCRTIT